MNTVSCMNAVPPPLPCIWSADDCYPAQVLHWLQQQADATPVATEEPELDVV